jgi:hypothetical protein
MIVAALGLYGERVEQAIPCIKNLRPNVDRYVVIVDETVTEKQKKQLKDLGCEVYFHPWEDSMVKMRNQYLDKIQTDDWVIVHDPDEQFNDAFCKDAKKICSEAEKSGFALLLINSHDATIQKDGTVSENVSDFFKNLIFQKKEGTYYVGVGEIKEVHEQLIIPGEYKSCKLNKQYWYLHKKYWWEVWERAARNVFMAGGGNNVGEKNPAWKPLREICDSLGLDNWTKTREYFRKGKIDERLVDWLWQNRYEGFDYNHEMMEFGRWYFEYLHPEEATREFKPSKVIEGDLKIWKPVTELKEGSPPEVMRYVEDTYMKILGRHADQEGKEVYTKAIVEGRLPREDLPTLLKQSAEFKQRNQQLGGSQEEVKLQVPVKVNVRLTEPLIVEALSKSKIFWIDIKPRLDLGAYLEVLLGDNYREFLRWFYEEKPGAKEFLAKIEEMIE